MAEAKIALTRAELDALVERAAEEGSKKALHAIGLHDEEAAADVRDLRGLLDAWREAKKTAMRTAVSFMIKAALVAMLAGVGFKFLVKE